MLSLLPHHYHTGTVTGPLAVPPNSLKVRHIHSPAAVVRAAIYVATTTMCGCGTSAPALSLRWGSEAPKISLHLHSDIAPALQLEGGGEPQVLFLHCISCFMSYVKQAYASDKVFTVEHLPLSTNCCWAGIFISVLCCEMQRLPLQKSGSWSPEVPQFYNHNLILLSAFLTNISHHLSHFNSWNFAFINDISHLLFWHSRSYVLNKSINKC